MKKPYLATASFWLHGSLVARGEVISITPSQAKYLGHALRAVEAADPDRPAVDAARTRILAALEARPAPAPVPAPKPKRTRRPKG